MKELGISTGYAYCSYSTIMREETETQVITELLDSNPVISKWDSDLILGINNTKT